MTISMPFPSGRRGHNRSANTNRWSCFFDPMPEADSADGVRSSPCTRRSSLPGCATICSPTATSVTTSPTYRVGSDRTDVARKVPHRFRRRSVVKNSGRGANSDHQRQLGGDEPARHSRGPARAELQNLRTGHRGRSPATGTRHPPVLARPAPRGARERPLCPRTQSLHGGCASTALSQGSFALARLRTVEHMGCGTERNLQGVP